jgi:hypothetical protein
MLYFLFVELSVHHNELPVSYLTFHTGYHYFVTTPRLIRSIVHVFNTIGA